MSAHESQGGFTLIELLVVVVIIGILAAIAIPSFLSQRATARDASAVSDLRNLAALQTALEAGGGFSDDPAVLAGEGWRTSGDTVVCVDTNAASTGIQVATWHPAGRSLFVWNRTTVSDTDLGSQPADCTDGLLPAAVHDGWAQVAP